MKLSFSTTLIASFASLAASECITPNGLHILEESGVRAGIEGALLSGQLPFLFLPLAEPFIAEFVKAETPIQFRLAQIHGSTVYHTAAKYHAKALDIWGNDVNRYCTEFVDKDYLKVHEEVATMLTFYYSAITLVPSSKPMLDPILDMFGLDANLMDLEDGPSTPWGMAKFVVEEMAATVVNDGWNADGMLANEYNTLAYSDFSIIGENGVAYDKYEVNHDLKQTGNFKFWPWQPLIESDGRGYFTKQEHVTPFAGFTTRLYGMDRSFYDSVKAPKPPQYDYEVEAHNVLEATRAMANNETQKMLLEYFDSKFTSILPIQINWSILSGESNFEFWYTDMVAVNTMYADALLLVWKEKVVYDLARPTTVVHELLKDQYVDSYAGPYQNSKLLKAQDWQPFVRVMPHSEYPSGSACICTAFSETMALLSGADDIAVPISHTFPAGSSKTEPGITPTTDITVQFTKWSEIAHACGESRLYGGMHFSKSVLAANEMCSNFINPVVENCDKLKAGDASGALADKNQAIEVTPQRKAGNNKGRRLRSG